MRCCWNRTAMPDPDPSDLFTAAGIVLDGEPVPTPPERQRRPKAPSPAQLAEAFAVPTAVLLV